MDHQQAKDQFTQKQRDAQVGPKKVPIGEDTTQEGVTTGEAIFGGWLFGGAHLVTVGSPGPSSEMASEGSRGDSSFTE